MPQQFYRAGLLRENLPPIYLTGPLPRDEADAWARNANGAVVVLPWPASPEEDEMAKPARRPATYEDLLDVPDHLIGEIIDGELLTHPTPAPKLVTQAFAELRRDPAIGRAEAMRRAMLAVMNDASRPAHWTPAAHPSVWAPFVVVGEGGTAR